MPWWVVADVGGRKRWLMGPYETQSRAISVRDGLDDGYAKVYNTGSSKRQEAMKEIRHKWVEEGGVEEGFKNFSHKGVEVE